MQVPRAGPQCSYVSSAWDAAWVFCEQYAFSSGTQLPLCTPSPRSPSCLPPQALHSTQLLPPPFPGPRTPWGALSRSSPLLASCCCHLPSLGSLAPPYSFPFSTLLGFCPRATPSSLPPSLCSLCPPLHSALLSFLPYCQSLASLATALRPPQLLEATPVASSVVQPLGPTYLNHLLI